MKKVLLIAISLCFTVMLHGQVSKNVNFLSNGLFAATTPTYKNSVTKLIVTADIDTCELKIMSNGIQILAILNIGGEAVMAYSHGKFIFMENPKLSNNKPKICFCWKHESDIS